MLAIRHGGRHDWYQNPKTAKHSQIAPSCTAFDYADRTDGRLRRTDDRYAARLLISSLMSTGGSTNQTVRCEVLNGLPGEGPIPRHFHLGHPTPWTEGFVVRFLNADGGEWVGNFQGGRFGPTEIVAWPEANSVALIVGHGFYLVDTDNPDNYLTLGPKCYASAAILSEGRTRLFVAEWYKVIAYGRDRRPIWESDGLSGVIISIGESNGVLELEVELEMDEPSVKVHLSADDGRRLG